MSYPTKRFNCKECGVHLSKSNAYKQSGGSAWRSRCRDCSTKQQRIRESKRFKDINYRAKFLWLATKNRAKLKALTFSLELGWIKERLVSGVCEATGIQLDWQTQSRNPGPWGPSIDRIDPKNGYTKDNSAIVCWAYNRAKGNDPKSVVITLARAVLKKESEYASIH